MFRRNFEEVETSEIFKDYAFRGFPLCSNPFLETFHEPCSLFHQGEKPDTKLLRIVPFILRYLLE